MKKFKFEGLIFDLDGTIVNSHSHTVKYLSHVLNKYGKLRLSEKEVENLFGPSEKMIFRKYVGPLKVNRCYEEYLNLFKNNIDEIHSYSGFPEILDYLCSIGEKLAIFTGRGRELTLFILEQKKLLKYFEVIITSEDVESHKPQPDGIIKICSLLKIIPSKILHIGNSPLDIFSGKKAGVFTGAALWGAQDFERLKEANPDYYFNQPEEIKRIFHE